MPVVPFAGTWIEIRGAARPPFRSLVVPFAGTWIEIGWIALVFDEALVVPFAGTWIEIYTLTFTPDFPSRTLRGYVD